MKFLLLFGPSAVGKATVGRAVAARTGLKLYHNHVSIEAVLPVFYFGTPQFNRLVKLIRKATLAEVAASDLPGVIFTMVWALDDPEDSAYVDELLLPFRTIGAEIAYVELAAPLAARLVRNRQPDRLATKPSKRDIATSDDVLRYELKCRLNTGPGGLGRPNHLRIDNGELSADAVADRIVTHFGWAAEPDDNGRKTGS